MSINITTAMVQQYKTGVMHLAQQKVSRLANAVRIEPGIVGEKASFDQLGTTAAQKRTTRHADTPIMNLPHNRRWVTLSDYDWGDLIDKADKLKTINEFTSPYQQAAAMAMGRAKDDEIIAAFFASSYTGKEGTATTAFDTTNYQIAAGGTGLTLAKLLTAKEMLDGGEEDEDEERFIACAAKQITNLLNTTEVKSSDYNAVKALAAGQLDTFLGFKFIRSQRLGTSSGSRRVAAWVRSGMILGIGEDANADIGPRRDKNNSIQVQMHMTLGATRTRETAVVEILCAE